MLLIVLLRVTWGRALLHVAVADMTILAILALCAIAVLGPEGVTVPIYFARPFRELLHWFLC